MALCGIFIFVGIHHFSAVMLGITWSFFFCFGLPRQALFFYGMVVVLVGNAITAELRIHVDL